MLNCLYFRLIVVRVVREIGKVLGKTHRLFQYPTFHKSV